MIRATTGGVMKNYRRNLMNSFVRQNNAINTMLTQRVFNSYAEDPSAAARAFRLRKARMTADAQYSVCSDALMKHQTGFSCLQKVSELIDTENGTGYATLKDTTLEMLNDPKGSARTQLAKVLDQIGETIVQNMNQKYGENFIFAGADGHNVPFEVKEVNGRNQLFYRGVSVDASEPKLMKDANDKPIETADGSSYVLADASTIRVREFEENAGALVTVTTERGSTLNVVKGATSITPADYEQLSSSDQLNYVKVTDGSGAEVYYKMDDLGSKDDYDAEVAKAMKDKDGNNYTVTIDGQDYYIVDNPDSVISKDDYNAAKTEAEKLKFLMGEKKFIDIGLGFQENENSQLIPSSAYNTALHGPNFLGYGLDDDGDPKNVYSLVQRMKEIADSVPEGKMWDGPTYDEFHGLVQKFEAASSEFKTAFTNMAASTTKLENNEYLLKENIYNLKEQYSEIEQVDMVDAINSFLWAQYSYNAALKVGNSVLSQSLMDYIN